VRASRNAQLVSSPTIQGFLDIARSRLTAGDQSNVRVRLALAGSVSARHQIRGDGGFRLGVTPAQSRLSKRLPGCAIEGRACDLRIPKEMGRLLSLMTRRGPFSNRRSFGRPRSCRRSCRLFGVRLSHKPPVPCCRFPSLHRAVSSRHQTVGMLCCASRVPSIICG
jgi:hypothetical protein